jgi:uncharacterized protein YjbI with pentapeptide repeats
VDEASADAEYAWRILNLIGLRSSARLKGADLRDANLSSAELIHANLRDADLRDGPGAPI